MASIDDQLKASREIADAIVDGLKTEQGVHAETAVAAAGRMAGTFLFRSFGLATSHIPPGSPVLSDVANDRGPVLVEVLKAGLSGLGLQINERAMAQQPPPKHQPQLNLLETQERLEPRLLQITSAHKLSGESAARSCALAAALLVDRTRSVLDPAASVGLIVYGFVEGTKTVPAPLNVPESRARPWYKFWSLL